MEYSEFIVLLARQRSGTNVLRSVLGSHPDIFCVPEVFNTQPDSWLVNAGNDLFFRSTDFSYFAFLEKYVGEHDLKSILLADDGSLFVDFLEYLRCFSDKRYLLLDVKYMSTHHVTKAWQFVTEEPFLFGLMKKYRLRVLNLTRKHFLRYYLSELKAQTAQNWHEFDESLVRDLPWFQSKRMQGSALDYEQRVAVDIDDVVRTLELCRSENAVIHDAFTGYEYYLTLDYEDLFPCIGAPLSDTVLKRIARWLDVERPFPTKLPTYKKQSYLPLRETLANYAEVEKALSGTKFEYCLADERIYDAGVRGAGRRVRA